MSPPPKEGAPLTGIRGEVKGNGPVIDGQPMILLSRGRPIEHGVGWQMTRHIKNPVLQPTEV